MGTAKQLLDVGGRPLLAHAVEAACASRLDSVVVVIGANPGAILAAVSMGRARTVVNTEHARGLSTSLRAGIDALGEDVDRAVVLLGDQPNVTAATIDALLDLQGASGLPAAALRVGELLQPPVVLARQLWPAVRGLEGDVGLRHLLRGRGELVATLGDGHDHGTADIDTPEDYLRLLRER